jgi:hypothetical protein
VDRAAGRVGGRGSMTLAVTAAALLAGAAGGGP